MIAKLIFPLDGTMRCIYSDDMPLRDMGSVTITRASHVEPGDDGKWYADLSPVDGPKLGPFDRRSDALDAEVDWLNRFYFTSL